jgi:uncharacterized protein (DUF1501 family)
MSRETPKGTALLTRRAFLQASGAAGAGMALAAVPRLAFASSAEPRRGDVLISIFLRGGLDGLSAVVPHQDPLYYARRPSIAVPASAVLDIDGQFGLHPALAPLQEVLRAGHLAIVQGVGSPGVDRSHFRGQVLVETGLAPAGTAPAGWIARHLAATRTDADGPVRAVGFAGRLQASLLGGPSTISTSDIDRFHLGGFDPIDVARIEVALRAMHPPGSGLPGRIGSVVHHAIEAVDLVERVCAEPYVPRGGVRYPSHAFGRQLRQVAHLLRADDELHLEAACLDLHGFDTHADQGTWQGGRLSSLLAELAGGLAAFYADLQDRLHEITIVVMSEFGRQVHENGSRGTDHGTAGCLFVMGGGVRGGLHGSFPGLADQQLFSPGGLAVTTDFRDVLAEIVSLRLGCPDPAGVFPGHSPRPVGCVVPLA